MIGKHFYYNKKQISYTTPDYRIGLTNVIWRVLDVSDSTINIQGNHGIKMTPTYLRGRRVILEGVIIADTREQTELGMKYLGGLFGVQRSVNNEGKKTFLVVDDTDKERTLQAKVKEPVEFQPSDDNYMDGSIMARRAVLQADDARYFSTREELVHGKEARHGGMKLGTKLGVKMNLVRNEIECLSSSGVSIPAKFVLTAIEPLSSPIKIINQNTKEVFGLNINCAIGDVITIDSEKKTAMLNNQNVLADRIEGSIRPTITGNTIFLVRDAGGGVLTNGIDVEIFYRIILL